MSPRLKKLSQHPYTPVIALLFVAFAWGLTFVIVADTLKTYPVFAYLSIRFFVATLAFLAIFPKTLKRINVTSLKIAVPAGIALSLGYIFQTMALVPADQGGTTPARTAFLTGMYVVIVPVLQFIIRRQKPKIGTVIGIVLAIAGLGFLSEIWSAGNAAWVLGDTYVLIAAIAYSFHMIILGRADETNDTLALTFIQLVMVTAICGISSLVFGENAGVPTTANVWFSIIICGVFASAVAFAIQTWAQQVMVPARVALILISEPAFGGIIGWLFVGVAPPFEVLGAALMLGGMIASEIIGYKLGYDPDEGALAKPAEFVGGASLEGPPVTMLKMDE